MSDKLDQADILAQHAQLTADLATAKQTIGTLTTGKTDIEAKLATAQATIAGLTADRDTLKAENAKLSGEKVTFEAAVAAKVATLGISDSGKKTADGKTTAKAPTLTDKILAAKGVKTLDELAAKMEAKRSEQVL